MKWTATGPVVPSPVVPSHAVPAWAAWLRRIGLDVRPFEAPAAISLFLHCFLVGSFQFAGKAIRQSTFIDALGAQNLPWVYLLVAVIAYPLLRFYSAVTERVRWDRVVIGTSLAIAASMVLFWWLFSFPSPWIRFVFYLWISITTVVAISQFWSYANNLFDIRQARRLYGLISAGGLLGGMAGGQLASLAGAVDPGVALLFGAALLVLVCAVVPLTERQRRVLGASALRPPEAEHDPRGGLEVIRSSSLLKLISAIMLLSVMVGQVVDLQFNSIVEARTTDLQERTIVFGHFYSFMGLAAFLFQLVFTSRIHRALGVGFAMKVLPVSVIAGSIGLVLSSLFFPGGLFLVASALKIGENGLRYSLDQSTRELLFVPVPKDDRLKAKSYVDVLVQRLAKGAAGVLLLTVTFGWLSVPGASVLSLVMCAVWLAYTRPGRRHYVDSLRQSLAPASLTLAGDRDERIDLSDVTTLEVLIQSLGSADPGQVLRSLELLSSNGRGHLVPPLLLYHDEPAVRHRTLQVLADTGRRDALPLIEKLIGDDDPDVRAEAIRSVGLLLGRAGPHMMHARLRDPDLRVRAAAISCLANQGDHDMVAEAEGALLELITDADPAAREEAAKALGEIEDPTFHPHLVTLLYDAVPAVERAAIVGVRKRVERQGMLPLYIPILISLLRNRRLKHEARHALVAYGKDIIPALVHFMNDPNEQIWVRRALPKTMARIGSPVAQQALAASLGAPDLVLRRNVIEALGSMADLDPSAELRRSIESQVEAECEAYLKTLSQLVAVCEPEAFEAAGATVVWRDGVEPNLLQRLLAERMKGHLSNLFDLLALLSDPRDIQVVRRRLVERTATRRSHALEYLDNVLAGPVRRSVLAVIDDLPMGERLRIAERTLGIRVSSKVDTLRELTASSSPGDETSPWVTAAALQAILLEREVGLFPEVFRQAETADEPLVRETAAWVRDQVQ